MPIYFTTRAHGARVISQFCAAKLFHFLWRFYRHKKLLGFLVTEVEYQERGHSGNDGDAQDYAAGGPEHGSGEESVPYREPRRLVAARPFVVADKIKVAHLGCIESYPPLRYG